MNVELQQLTVFNAKGLPTDRIWVGVVAGAVINVPELPHSVKEAKEAIVRASKLLVGKDSLTFSIHPQCQTKQHKKGRRDSR